jgi:hypothetical protein
MTKFRLAQTAYRDLEDIRDYISKDSPENADGFIELLIERGGDFKMSFHMPKKRKNNPSSLNMERNPFGERLANLKGSLKPSRKILKRLDQIQQLPGHDQRTQICGYLRGV